MLLEFIINNKLIMSNVSFRGNPEAMVAGAIAVVKGLGTVVATANPVVLGVGATVAAATVIVYAVDKLTEKKDEA